MIGLLLFPILVCGYLFITSWPTERIRISLYQGWSLYIRATAFGMVILTLIIVTFGVFLPAIGLWLGNATGFTLLPDSNLFMLLSDFIEESQIFHLENSQKVKSSLDIASTSIVSISITWIITASIRWVSTADSGPAKKISKLFKLEDIKNNSVETVFAEKAPIEHQLYIILKKADVDVLYNKEIEKDRKEVFEAIADGRIDRKNKELMEAIFDTLEYRDINHALISLENEKFYIGLPLIIPEPDEESVASNSIQIVPVMSGYRKEDKTLAFTTEYDFDLSSTSSHDCVSIPRDRILTVSGFKFETHRRISRLSGEKMKKRDSSYEAF